MLYLPKDARLIECRTGLTRAGFFVMLTRADCINAMYLGIGPRGCGASGGRHQFAAATTDVKMS